MPRHVKPLTDKTIQTEKRPGMHAAGGAPGLYLHVAKAKPLPGDDDKPQFARSWIFRYRAGGKLRDMGLGSLQSVSLAEAREEAQKAHRLLRRDGVDPIEARKAARAAAVLEAVRVVTFKECAEAYIASRRDGWRNEKHAAQWGSTLETYAYPVFGSLSVRDVDTALVTKAVEPIWKTKTETASRLRGRIEAVLDWATVRGYRAGDNPARWRGHLQHVLDVRAKTVEHHAALPYAEIGEFMADLRAQEGVSARALDFLILTATRTSEAIGATWGEFDLDAATWTIPAERMKAKKKHIVPLPAPALALVRQLAEAKTGEYVFPGGKQGKPLSNMALLKLLQRMGRDDLTAHGFRSTFRDWAAERTNFPREVAEMALAHTVSDKVEAAYRRGELLQKRRQMMEAWAKHCATVKPAGAVVPMQKAAAQ